MKTKEALRELVREKFSTLTKEELKRILESMKRVKRKKKS